MILIKIFSHVRETKQARFTKAGLWATERRKNGSEDERGTTRGTKRTTEWTVAGQENLRGERSGVVSGQRAHQVAGKGLGE